MSAFPHPLVLLAGLVLLTGCEGSNLFRPGATPVQPEPTVDTRAEILRYVEEGTLLVSGEDRLRFRWMELTPSLSFGEGVGIREREAFEAALKALEPLGLPAIPVEEEGGRILVRAFPPDQYRELDPTRPWSFTRSFVTATEASGISEVEILLSLELEAPVLQRTVLHALGHALGIMGHPAFPGASFIMAASPESAPPPRSFHPWEAVALRFLYSPEVRVGMTRGELRELWSRYSF